MSLLKTNIELSLRRLSETGENVISKNSTELHVTWKPGEEGRAEDGPENKGMHGRCREMQVLFTAQNRWLPHPDAIIRLKSAYFHWGYGSIVHKEWVGCQFRYTLLINLAIMSIPRWQWTRAGIIQPVNEQMRSIWQPPFCLHSFRLRNNNQLNLSRLK